jgi:hypothetical protein
MAIFPALSLLKMLKQIYTDISYAALIGHKMFWPNVGNLGAVIGSYLRHFRAFRRNNNVIKQTTIMSTLNGICQ